MLAERPAAPRIALGVFFAALLVYLSILGDRDLAFSPAAPGNVEVDVMALEQVPPGSPKSLVALPLAALAGTRADVDLPRYRQRLRSFGDWQIGYLIANFRTARAERQAIITY